MNEFKRAWVLTGGIEVRATKDAADIGASGRKIDSLEKVGGGEVFILFRPAAGMGDAGVIFGQSEDFGPVGEGPAFHGTAEVPGTGGEVGLGVKEIGILERALARGLGPILGGTWGDLHEASFPGSSDGLRIKITLSPDNGSNERGVETVALGRLRHEGGELLGAAEFSQPRKSDEGQGGKNKGKRSENTRTSEEHRKL